MEIGLGRTQVKRN